MYYYTTVSLAKAKESAVFGTNFSTNAYHLIGRFLLARSIPGSKRDLLSGDRVYRIHENDVVRLDLDGLERRILPTRIGDFLFIKLSTDPTATVPVKDCVWLPVGP